MMREGYSTAGRSIRQILEDELLAVTRKLLTGEASAELRGQAQGLAFAIAIMTNPYNPNVDDVKKVVMERYGDSG